MKSLDLLRPASPVISRYVEANFFLRLFAPKITIHESWCVCRLCKSRYAEQVLTESRGQAVETRVPSAGPDILQHFPFQDEAFFLYVLFLLLWLVSHMMLCQTTLFVGGAWTDYLRHHVSACYEAGDIQHPSAGKNQTPRAIVLRTEPVW